MPARLCDAQNTPHPHPAQSRAAHPRGREGASKSRVYGRWSDLGELLITRDQGVDICTNKELFESLQKVKRIEFDVSRKLLLYRNPYQSITTPELLLEYINKNAVVKGLRVNEELLNANAKMIEWLDEIMKQRKVRAVRSNSSHIKGTIGRP